MNHKDHLALVDRICTAQMQINRLPNGRTKLDLKKLFSNVISDLNDCDKLSVECRRLGKVTSEFTSRYAKLGEAVSNLEQYLLMALLITSE